MVAEARQRYQMALGAWEEAGVVAGYSDGLVGEVRARLARLSTHS